MIHLVATCAAVYLLGAVLGLFVLFVLDAVWILHLNPARHLAHLLLDAGWPVPALWVRPASLVVPSAVACAVAACALGALFPQAWCRFVLLFATSFYLTLRAFGVAPVETAVWAAVRMLWPTGVGFILGAVMLISSLLVGAIVGARLGRSRKPEVQGWLSGWPALDLRDLVRNRVLVLRLLVAAGLVVLAMLGNWRWLQHLTRDTVWLALQAVGIPTECGEYEGDPTLTIGEHGLRIVAECTGVAFFLTLVPLVWGVGLPLVSNVWRICLLAAAVFGVNVGRIAVSTVLYAVGWSWSSVVGFPNALLFTGSMAVALVARMSEMPAGDRGAK